MLTKEQEMALIAGRIAREMKDGYAVNLGIGYPTAIPNHLPKGVHVMIHSENGIVGMGPRPKAGEEDPDMINAGGASITAIKGASYVDSATSFAIIRGGHLSMTVLGALQVDQEGSIANWMIPGKFTPGMGGAMDLAVGAKQVVAALKHVDKDGKSKVVKKCDLPLTGYKSLTLIVTDMAFMRVTEKGLVLEEVAYWTNVDEVVKNTEAELLLPGKIGVFHLPE